MPQGLTVPNHGQIPSMLAMEAKFAVTGSVLASHQLAIQPPKAINSDSPAIRFDRVGARRLSTKSSGRSDFRLASRLFYKGDENRPARLGKLHLIEAENASDGLLRVDRTKRR